MGFQSLESVTKICEGYSRCFKVSGQKLLLVHSAGQTRLLPIACPHEGHSLKNASLQNGRICCPKHNISFNLDDGSAVGGEVVADVAPLRSIELVEQSGYLGVLTEDI